jgi:hypothetical protein
MKAGLATLTPETAILSRIVLSTDDTVSDADSAKVAPGVLGYSCGDGRQRSCKGPLWMPFCRPGGRGNISYVIVHVDQV